MPRSKSGISKVAAAVIAVIVIIALIIGVYYATLPAGPTPTPATPTPTPKTPTPTTPTPTTPTPTPATPTPTPTTPTPTPATPTPTPTTPTPTPATPTPTPTTPTPTPATPTPTPGPEKIKVGMIVSLTGAQASSGRLQRIIADEAVKMINSEGGIYVKQYGRKIPIDLIVYDDESNPSRGTELAMKLVMDVEVPAVICSSYAQVSTPVAKVTERYGVPLLNAGTPVEFFAAAGPWNYSWSNSMSYDRIMKGFVAFLNNYRGQTNNKVGVVLSDDIIGRTQVKMLTPMLEQAGYTVFNPGLYPPDTTDFAAVIMQLKLANCEILWEHGTPPIFAAFWRQCNMLGYKPKIFYQSGGLARLEDVRALGGDLALGIITHLVWHEDYPFPLSTAYRELWRKYLTEQGIDLSPVGGYYYTVWFILKDAIERAGTLDRQAINKAISETNMMGACGPVVFDLKTHGSSGYMTLGQWIKSDGTWLLEPIWSEVPQVKVITPIFPLP
ncbi:MAG: ABC transporter substrate-binding protein [Candidatus Bathyarchaeia archaeon]